ncbi:hypothetical protein [Shewanella glacialimarina]|uniref:hypothetical protein n=1 Tax=Shewanella glacialimarina TaxID=2590884 RepID=UPI001CF89DD7|nr:hypothetical protein [Shewanella glacialimarina]UCX04538.1 hypothetical protein FJ709_08525 [Shewanella glacialimarina]
MINDSNSYFSVPHQFNVYLSPWDKQRPIPDDTQLRQMQSTGLKLLSEVKALESNCLLQLRQLDSATQSIVEFLKLQSRKVDLVLQHVLEKEAQAGVQYQGHQFGGSGLSLFSDKQMDIGSIFSCHIYLHAEVVAVLCICEVTGSYPADKEEAIAPNNPATIEQALWQTDLAFIQILDEDVEQLVKASLTVQQKMLKLRKQLRKDNL